VASTLINGEKFINLFPLKYRHSMSKSEQTTAKIQSGPCLIASSAYLQSLHGRGIFNRITAGQYTEYSVDYLADYSVDYSVDYPVDYSMDYLDKIFYESSCISGSSECPLSR